MGAFRDRLAQRLCNFILRTIATPWYRRMTEGAIRYGLEAAARDDRPAMANRNGKVSRRCLRRTGNRSYTYVCFDNDLPPWA